MIRITYFAIFLCITTPTYPVVGTIRCIIRNLAESIAHEFWYTSLKKPHLSRRYTLAHDPIIQTSPFIESIRSNPGPCAIFAGLALSTGCAAYHQFTGLQRPNN